MSYAVLQMISFGLSQLIGQTKICGKMAIVCEGGINDAMFYV